MRYHLTSPKLSNNLYSITQATSTKPVQEPELRRTLPHNFSLQRSAAFSTRQAVNPSILRLLSNFGANCLLPMQKVVNWVKSARMMGIDWLSQCKSASEATSCTYVLEIRGSAW